MPQTEKSLALLRQYGIEKLAVYMNKMDVIDEDLVEFVKMDLDDLLGENDYNDVPLFLWFFGKSICLWRRRLYRYAFGDDQIF